MKISKRKFLTIATSLLFANSSKSKSAAKSRKYDTIIIGAGISGLNAAMILKNQGAKVLILEGSNRVGGRIYTGDHIEGRPELGASQVGPYYGRVRDMAYKMGIKLLPGSNQTSPYAFFIKNNLIAKEAWQKHPLNYTQNEERARPPSALLDYFFSQNNNLLGLGDWLDNKAHQYDIPLASWLSNNGASKEALRLINEGPIDADIWNVSALHLLHNDARGRLWFSSKDSPKDLDRFQKRGAKADRIEGGSSRLPEAMAKTLENELLLEQIATKIDMSSKEVNVECMSGKTYRASFLISAIPFKTLSRITITPPPKESQLEAIRLLPYRANSQVHLIFKGKNYWEIDGYDASIWSTGPISLLRHKLDPSGRRDLLQAVCVGKKAERLDLLKPEDRGKFVINEIERIRPSLKGKLEVTAVHSWSEEPLIRGFRHSFFPGQIKKFANKMSIPHHLMHYAGEHTRRIEIGMESAMESGERAALEVLEKL